MPNELVPMAPLSQLEYAARPTVGRFALSLSGETVIVHVHPSWRRAALDGWVWLAWLLVVVIPLLVAGYFQTHAQEQRIFLVAAGICTLALLGQIAARLMIALAPAKWEIDPRGMSYTSRRVLQVLHGRVAVNIVADVRVERLRLKDQVLPRKYLVVIDRAGSKHAIAFGTPAELDFLCRTCREVWGLPQDPTGEATYPKPLLRWSRARRKVVPGGVVVTLAPPLVPWLAACLIVPAIAVVPAVFDRLLFERDDAAWMPTMSETSRIVRLILWTLLAAIALFALIRKLRRWTVIGTRHGAVELVERGMRPARERWAAEQVAGFRLIPGRSARRSNLLLELSDRPVELLQNQPTRLVEFMHASLQRGLEIAREAQSGNDAEERASAEEAEPTVQMRADGE